MAAIVDVPLIQTSKIPNNLNTYPDLDGASRNFSNFPSTFPASSMTQASMPPFKQIHGGVNRRPKKGEPFDPDELTRRLSAHVAQQKILSKQRKEARAAKERAAAGLSAPADFKVPVDAIYHHVPSVAAVAFQRTATPSQASSENSAHHHHHHNKHAASEDVSPTHPKSSLPSRQKSTKRPTTTLQQAILHDQAEAERERIRNRNPFQLTKALEEAAEMDELRDVYRMPVRSFGGLAGSRAAAAGAGGGIGANAHHLASLSAGDVFSPDAYDGTEPPPVGRGSQAAAATRRKSLRIKPGFGGRNDWAQTQETSPKSQGTRGSQIVKGVAPEGTAAAVESKVRTGGPWLKGKERVWVMMGRREKSKAEEESPAVTPPGSMSPPALDGKSLWAKIRRMSTS